MTVHADMEVMDLLPPEPARAADDAAATTVDIEALLRSAHPRPARERNAEPQSEWQALWRYVVGAGLICVLGWFAFVAGKRVPLLSMADLGFHELGHLVCYILGPPQTVTAAMGSIFQILVPVGLAVYFLWRRRDVMAGSLMLAWAATNCQDVSVYIADAPFQRLPLLGGDNSTHDWAFLLSGSLPKAAGLSHFLWGVGLVMLLASLVLCLSAPFWLKRR